MSPVPAAELVCTAMLALALWNLWSGFARNRVVAHYGMATRDNPWRFWSAVVFWGFAAALFGLLLLTFLDPRDFKPVLRIMICKQALVTCVQAEWKGMP
jgi:hypothetical protein